MKVLDYDGLEYYNSLVEDKYLPKSGGTMTGAITAFAIDFIKRNVNDSHLTIMGGTAYNNSASLRLAGGDETSQTGLFQLRAQNGTTSKDLVGKPDGTFTWDGTAISLNGHTHSYLPLSGGTLTGALNLANNTWNKAGDDASFGDHNVSGKLCVKTQSSTATGLAFFNSSDTNVGQVEVNNAFNFNKTIQQNGTDVSLSGHTHSYLPLSGGTLTGNETISKSAPRFFLKDTVIARNTAPSSNYAQVEITGTDKNDVATWGLYHRYWTTKQHEVALICYKGTTTDNTFVSIGCGFDSSGNAYTYAPTPATSDNSTKIATTAYVKSNLTSVGTTASNSTSSDISVSATTGKNITSVSLAAGTWVITGHLRYGSVAADKAYGAAITDTSNTFSYNNDGSTYVHSSSNLVVSLDVTRIMKLTATKTIYLVAYSNNAATVSSGATIQAVRII